MRSGARLRHAAGGVLLALLSALGGGDARADGDPTTEALSPYESEIVRHVLLDLGAEIDPSPQGKIVEDVIPYPLEAVQPGDPLPRSLNAIHTTTKKEIVLREVLLHRGDRYVSSLAREMCRNLRLRTQLSLVLCVPLHGSTPDTTRLLVVTRDIWSLRPDFGLTVTSGGIDTFLLQVSEINLAGRYAEVAVDYMRQPETHAFGQTANIPWFLGSRLTLRERAWVYVNQLRGEPEGMYAELGIQKPQLSSFDRWSWGLWGRWDNRVVRRYVNARVATFESSTGEVGPDAYRVRRPVVQALAMHSWGQRNKLDLAFGAEAAARVPSTLGLENASDAFIAEYQHARMPTRDLRVGPFVRVHAYKHAYAFLEDLNTLGLQEDYRVGPEFAAKVFPVTRALGSTRNFLGTSLSFQYTATPGASLLRFWVGTAHEFSTEQLYDSVFNGSLFAATPPLGIGRIVTQIESVNRIRNYNNLLYEAGGDTRPRGFPTNYVFGPSIIGASTEFRSRSFRIFSTHVGLVLFHDAADAFTTRSTLRPKHSVGAGTRLVVSALGRNVIRFDVGFPINPSQYPGVSPVGMFLSFVQPFEPPSIWTADTSGAPAEAGALGL